MGKYQIRLNKTDSVNSVNKENFLDVQLKSTSKKLHFNDIKNTIDQYEQFNKERSECTKYRVILTINPYCTNVLFNPLTEIAKKIVEGNAVKVERYFLNSVTMNGIDGNDNTFKRVQMVSNTEYSKTEKKGNGDDKYGYTYMPGYDIFDNHTLRNNGFKLVEPKINNTLSDQNGVFNTLGDYDRSSDGKVLSFKKRVNLTSKPQSKNKHLYTSDDVLSFEDSVNANLTDENGWFGFINASNLRTADTNDENYSNICRVLNDRKACEFIDMYPDRTLFSFSPKYNAEQQRLENNWDVFLTYAFESDYCNDLVSYKSLNALAVMSVTLESGISGEDIYVFRCYTKHNLKKNDTIKVYACGEENYETPVGVYRVSNVGNAGKGDPEYYFYVNGFEAEGIENYTDIRIKKTYNGMDSAYYIRKLKKIKNGEKDLNCERYKLAFASTIYDDDTTQFTFTDNVDVADLRDNLGRPLTEIFVTIVKKNAGHEKWYSVENGREKNLLDKDVEISHCFGDVSTGFILSHEKQDTKDIKKNRESMRDARVINKWNYFGSTKYPILITPYGTVSKIKGENNENIDVTEDDVFYGDIVEYSPEDCMEHVLSDCAHRFNTHQREESLNGVRVVKPMVDEFIYHEINVDDYDIVNNNISETFIRKEAITNYIRNEGYYYKANYSIPIRGVGDIQQAGHKDIRVRSVKPVYNGSVILDINSKLPSRLNTNDTVYVCDDKSQKMFEFVCTRVKSPTQFSIEPNIKTDNRDINDKWASFLSETELAYGNENGLDWLQLSKLLIDGSLKLRGKNYDIPDNAFKVGNNAYVWRDAISPGETSEANETPEYTFTNGAFYITPIIRFYLKRQDPDGLIGLYNKKDFPNDVYGNIQKDSNYYYDDDIQEIC